MQGKTFPAEMQPVLRQALTVKRTDQVHIRLVSAVKCRRWGGEWVGGAGARPRHRRHRRGEEEAGNGPLSPLRVGSQNPKTGSWRSHSRAGISRLCSLQPYLLCTWVAGTRRRCTFWLGHAVVCVCVRKNVQYVQCRCVRNACWGFSLH